MASAAANTALVRVQGAFSRVATLRAEHDQLRKDFDALKAQVAKDQKVLEMLSRWKERVRGGMRRAKQSRDRS